MAFRPGGYFCSFRLLDGHVAPEGFPGGQKIVHHGSVAIGASELKHRRRIRRDA